MTSYTVTARLLVAALFATSLLVACHRDETQLIDPNAKNTVSVEFDNRVGDQKLVLGNTTYRTGSGEEFSVSTLNYFVSNVALTNADGTVLKLPNQYFLIRQADARTQTIQLKDVPAGNYNAITFMIGVDSLKSTAPVAERTGVLDPTTYGNDFMYWSWNSGYIFLKLEGTSPVVPLRNDGSRTYQFHVGGFGGMTARTPNNLRTVTLPISTAATVRANVAPVIHVVADLRRIFDGPNKLSLATTNSVHMPMAATPIADNYRTMFVVDHVHNDGK